MLLPLRAMAIIRMGKWPQGLEVCTSEYEQQVMLKLIQDKPECGSDSIQVLLR